MESQRVSGEDGDAIPPDEMDEVGLWKELGAEENIEEDDREAARMYRRGLWMEIGVTEVDNKPVEILVQKREGTEACGIRTLKGTRLD